jgi:excisionase family DNA binding protein
MTTTIETIDSDECAALLRCTSEQVEELARAGEIPGLKIGRSWLFVRSDLLAYLAEKARREADERRAKRQPGVVKITAKPKRRQPPPLMLPTA